jgi:hypothetical protein
VITHLARGSWHLASILLWIVVLGVAGCLPLGPSELVVQNRTLVTIAFDDHGPKLIGPCSSATFAWQGFWHPVAAPPPPDPNAVPIRVDLVPFEAPIHAVVIVDQTGARAYSPDEVSSLPPSAGSPQPLATPVPSKD